MSRGLTGLRRPKLGCSVEVVVDGLGGEANQPGPDGDRLEKSRSDHPLNRGLRNVEELGNFLG